MRSLDFPGYRRVGWSIAWNLAEAQLRLERSVVLDGVAREVEVVGTRDLARRLAARSVVVVMSCANTSRLRQRVEGRERAIPGWHELTWESVRSSLDHWATPSDADRHIDTADDPDLSPFLDRIAVRAGR